MATETLWAQPLFDEGDFTYLGAFRVPDEGRGGSSFSYGGRAAVFNPAGNQGRGSLFIVGKVHEQMIAEISIVTPVISDDKADLNRADFLQDFFDVEANIPNQGNMLPLGAFSEQRGAIAGLLLKDGKLIGGAYTYYDNGSANRQRDSHFVIDNASDMANAKVTGFFNVGLKEGAGGVTGGWMTAIPSNWTGRLGKPYLTGMCCTSVIGRSSYGPAAFAFDPEELTGSFPDSAPVIPYLKYGDKELGAYRADWSWTEPGHQWVETTGIGGMFIPDRSDTLVFIGGTGVGSYCYGKGTSDQSLHGQEDPSDGGHWCHDPTNTNKGGHAWPYSSVVYLYDLNDFVKKSLSPGMRRPYRVFPLPDYPTDPKEIRPTSVESPTTLPKA